jgi:protein-S-isoprenylcysteine O-methyltransferase Ste14
MKNTNMNYSIGKLVCMSLLILAFFPSVIFLLSGNISWAEGWIFSIWIDAMMLTNIVFMYKRNPSLITERLTAHGSHNQKKWDKYLLASLFSLSAIWLIAMPLDAELFHLSPRFSLPIKAIGCILLIPAYYLLIRATIDNPYLSTVVRIQSDQKQKVITIGTYGIIRHPQYLGTISMIIGSALLLGSIIGLIIGIFLIAIIIARIIGEEKMLVTELDGYVEYRQKVKYRLLPYVW